MKIFLNNCISLYNNQQLERRLNGHECSRRIAISVKNGAKKPQKIAVENLIMT